MGFRLTTPVRRGELVRVRGRLADLGAFTDCRVLVAPGRVWRQPNQSMRLSCQSPKGEMNV